MKEGPSIAPLAALIGDPARANMLTALMAGQALTASELALEAGVTKQTASSHLAKLADAELVTIAAQGRHRYYRLAGRHVAALLENLMGVAARSRVVRTRPGPKEPALGTARCSLRYVRARSAAPAWIGACGGRIWPVRSARHYWSG